MHRLVAVLTVISCLAACSSSDGPDVADEPGPTSSTTAPDAPEESTVYPGAEWERAEPEEMGFDPEALEAIARDADDLDSSCLVVTRKGRIVGEWYWDDGAPDEPREVFSVTKSVISTLVGVAVSDGNIDIDDPAAEQITEWAGTDSAEVTVRNLLSNDSGRNWNPGQDYVQLPQAADRTQWSIDLDQEFPPGTAWSYNNAAIQTLDRVISVATDQTTAAFAQERLLDPLGMADSTMTSDPSGHSTNAFIGLQSTCEDLARFGYLFLRDGQWEDEAIVSPEWIEEATGAPSQEHNAAYGFLWWLNQRGRLLGPLQAVSPVAEPEEVADGQIAPGAPEDLFTAQGMGGQIVMVDPGSETVVVRLGEGAAGDPLAGYNAAEAARVVTEALTE